MQIWIYFEPGTGGDGIANLFEHSNNVNTIDHRKCVHATPDRQYWRVDRFVDNRPKFWAPGPDSLHCFRQGQWFDSTLNKLSDTYLNIVESNINTIVTSHDCTLKNLNISNCREIFTKNQIKILLQSTQTNRILKNFLEKNLINYNKNNLPNFNYRKIQIFPELFDHVVDVDDLLTSWDQVKSFTELIGLSLNKTFFDEFCSIRSAIYSPGLFSDTTPRYRTVVSENGNVNYEQLKISL
jgi:hypothetical protein